MFILVTVLMLWLAPLWTLAHAVPDLPKDWKETILLDQTFNVPAYENVVLTPEQRAIVPVLHFDLPANLATVYSSRFLEKKTRNLISPMNMENSAFVRFYFVDDGSEYTNKLKELLKKRSIKIRHQYWGTRVQSHRTYFIWDPSAPDLNRFFIKMQGKDEEGFWFNQRINGKLSVKINDFLISLLSKEKDLVFSFLQEPFAASFMAGEFEYSYSVRMAPKPKPGLIRYPVHGFWGSKAAWKELARAAGMSPDIWREKEYISNFARAIAVANIRYGLLPSAHAQNSLFQANPLTGKVELFEIRDLNDLMLDAMVFATQNKPFPTRDLKSVIISQTYSHHVDTSFGVNTNIEPGSNLATYTLGSVWTSEIESDLEPRATAVFVDAYLAQVQDILKRNIKLPTTHEDYLTRMRKGLLPQVADADNPLDVGDFSVDVATDILLQDIHDEVSVIRNKKIPIPPTITHSQSVLKSIFEAQAKVGQVAYAHQKSKKYVLSALVYYVYSGTIEGILAIDPLTQFVHAIAYNIAPSQCGKLLVGSVASNNPEAPKSID